MNTQATRCLAMICIAVGAATSALLAAPPPISETEVEARLAQYRAEMSRIDEREHRWQEQAEIRLRNERLHRERQAAYRDVVAQADAHDLTEQAELGRLEFE